MALFVIAVLMPTVAFASVSSFDLLNTDNIMNGTENITLNVTASSGEYLFIDAVAIYSNQSWRSPQKVHSALVNNQTIPSVVADSNGYIYVTYAEMTDGGFNLTVSSSYDGGANWVRRRVLVANESIDGLDSALDSNGYLHIVFQTGANISYVNSTTKGVTFSNTKVLDKVLTTTNISFNPSIAIDSSNKIYVAYNYQDSLGNSTVVMMNSSDWFAKNATINSSALIPTNNTAHVDMVAVSGTIHYTYADYKNKKIVYGNTTNGITFNNVAIASFYNTSVSHSWNNTKVTGELEPYPQVTPVIAYNPNSTKVFVCFIDGRNALDGTATGVLTDIYCANKTVGSAWSTSQSANTASAYNFSMIGKPIAIVADDYGSNVTVAALVCAVSEGCMVSGAIDKDTNLTMFKWVNNAWSAVTVESNVTERVNNVNMFRDAYDNFYAVFDTYDAVYKDDIRMKWLPRIINQSSESSGTYYYFNITLKPRIVDNNYVLPIYANGTVYSLFNITVNDNKTDSMLEFAGYTGTTDFAYSSVQDYSAVTLELNNSYGTIEWQSTVDLTKSHLDFDRDVNIADKNITVHSNTFGELDGIAKLSFYGLTYNEIPSIYKDGTLCGFPSCYSTAYNPDTGVYTVYVTGFSTYTLSAQTSGSYGGGGGNSKGTPVQPEVAETVVGEEVVVAGPDNAWIIPVALLVALGVFFYYSFMRKSTPVRRSRVRRRNARRKS